MPEEESFCVLVKLMRDYRMREMFKPSMSELGLCMYQLEVLVQEHVPDLYAHFQSQSIHTNLYASSWFLTLFTTVVPISLACRYDDKRSTNVGIHFDIPPHPSLARPSCHFPNVSGLWIVFWPTAWKLFFVWLWRSSSREGTTSSFKTWKVSSG